MCRMTNDGINVMFLYMLQNEFLFYLKKKNQKEEEEEEGNFRIILYSSSQFRYSCWVPKILCINCWMRLWKF